jgi:hypothetical protein
MSAVVEEIEVKFSQFDFALVEVDPEIATEAKPGSEEKVVMLAARYAAGLPLWHNSDCVDHGPGTEEEED